MVNINLTPNPKNPYEGIVLSYLQEFASPALAERINNGSKTLAQCWNYVTRQAQKEAHNGCACIQDDTVYGWIIHFFEEDEIKGDTYNKGNTVKVASSKEIQPAEKPMPPKKVKSVSPGLDQFSFDDLFG